eukprot:1743112-Rhodomonas_salina.2
MVVHRKITCSGRCKQSQLHCLRLQSTFPQVPKIAADLRRIRISPRISVCRYDSNVKVNAQYNFPETFTLRNDRFNCWQQPHGEKE